MGIREDDSLAFALQAVAGATLSTQVLVVITTISSILSLLKVTENMVHPGGFEPPTARFVAEYSIQLSYGCIGKIYFTADIDIATKAISSKRWCIREDYSPCGSATSINYDPKRGILVVQVIFDYQGEQDSERPFSGSSFEIVAKMELLLRDNVWSLVENSLELTSVNSNVDNDWYD